MIGTPQYMSPEIITNAQKGLGELAGLDLEKVDVFSVGSILFQLLTLN